MPVWEYLNVVVGYEGANGGGASIDGTLLTDDDGSKWRGIKTVTAAMNDLGKQGWELVCMEPIGDDGRGPKGDRYVFKRTQS